jgi:pSer/pThr/pTyr-binding forkhead associated (FHA) protein/tetratricopeptide (TPR) repeat protein
MMAPAPEGEAEPALSFTNPGLEAAPVLNMESTQSGGAIDQDASTKVLEATDIKARLVLKSGVSSSTEFEIEKDEISIGRGKDCDIIIDDKKVSRKNTIICREGNRFLIKDLESANGTYVNGHSAKEVQLYGEDVIKVGNTEFKFVAMSEGYAQRSDEFSQIAKASVVDPSPAGGVDVPEITLPPPVDGGAPSTGISIGSAPVDLGSPSLASLSSPPPPKDEMTGSMRKSSSGGLSGLYQSPYTQSPKPAQLGGTRTINVMGIPGLPGAGPVPGLPGSQGKQEKGFIARFRRMNKRQQWITIAVVIALGWTLLWDDDEDLQTGPQKKPPAVAVKKDTTKTPGAQGGKEEKAQATFEALSPDKKRFVETQHNLAFDYYRNKEYAKALFEIQKIFDIVPDYKDSREIERYAQEGKRRQEAQEEERRKKEEEAQLKAKVSALMDEARLHMNKKQYEQAREIFNKLLALDPDNPRVSEWKKEIEDWEEKQRLADQERQIRKEINDRSWGIYKRGVALKKQGKYHTAIAVLSKVIEDGATDKRLSALARKAIASCRAIIASRRGPLMAEGEQAEHAGEFKRAYDLYLKALRIDPAHRPAAAGIERVRGVLHDRAKAAYTEAVLAESYSDFDTAKNKYRDILNVAPYDDIYYERAQRKLGHYFQRGLTQEQ